MPNTLYYGDNLDVLRQNIADESVDLIYLDPPFNSNATYNVLFKTHAGDESRAQIQAFDDTWGWGPQADDEYAELTQGRAPIEVARFIQAMRTVLGTSDMFAYLVMMAPRLVEMKRVLRGTGTIWLHCDPTASHYLKLLMDAVFGVDSFRNEIIWSYKRWTASRKTLPRLHDVILLYSKGSQFTLNIPTVPNDNPNSSQYVSAKDEHGKTVVARDEYGHPIRRQVADRIQLGDVWEIGIISPNGKERLGYPTQKPLNLLQRVIETGTNPGDVVLDPFCGCGTAVDAAQLLKRQWIGIDITYIAVDLIIKRLQHRYGDEIRSTFTTNGIPTDIEGAEALFARNPFDFERWAVSMVSGEPNEKQVGDKGVDGRIRFHRGGSVTGLAAVSVKGGHQINPSMVHSLVGAMGDERADMGVLITLHRPTSGMLETANRAGIYEHPPTGNRYPRVQIITVPELFDGKRPNMPTVILPYIKASPRPQSEAVSLFDRADEALDEDDEQAPLGT
ncbi:MAG: DNA methyltransferase [Acidimicrobiales bacterium]